MPEATRKATTAVGAALLAAAAALVLGWLGPLWLIGVTIVGVVALSVLAIVERRGQQRLVREQAKAAHRHTSRNWDAGLRCTRPLSGRSNWLSSP
jgi:hypothetical protein